MFLVGLSGATTTMRSTIGPIRSNPQTRAFLLDLMREVVAVGRAHGVDLPADYAEQRLARRRPRRDMTSSMHHDLERGNRLEVRWLSGGVVELGRDVGCRPRSTGRSADILALRAEGGTAAVSAMRRHAPRLTVRAHPHASPSSVPMRFALGTSAATVRDAPLLLIDLETEEGVTGRSLPVLLPAERRARDRRDPARRRRADHRRARRAGRDRRASSSAASR